MQHHVADGYQDMLLVLYLRFYVLVHVAVRLLVLFYFYNNLLNYNCLKFKNLNHFVCYHVADYRHLQH